MKSRSAPDVINKRSQKMHLLLEALANHVDEIVPELHAAGDKRWSKIITKGSMLSHQVKTLDQRAHEYLNAEARKTIPPNVNVCKSANHCIRTDCENHVNNEQTTRVLPYAGGTQSVTCPQNNDCNVLHRKKIRKTMTAMSFTGRKSVFRITRQTLEKDNCQTCILFALRAHVRLNFEVTDSLTVWQRLSRPIFQ